MKKQKHFKCRGRMNRRYKKSVLIRWKRLVKMYCKKQKKGANLLMKNHDTVRINVKKLRKKLNLTQMELAARLDVSLNSIVKWENNAGKPSDENYKKLQKLL